MPNWYYTQSFATTTTQKEISWAGVYLLKFTKEFNYSKYYVGSSKNIIDRYNSHIKTLVEETHHNQRMQRIYNKYNIIPELIILDICSMNNNELLEYEIKWYNYYKNKFGCNLINAIFPCRHDVSDEIVEKIKNGLRKSNKANFKGLSYEERFGYEKAQEMKFQQSVSRKGRTPWNKGLTKEKDEKMKKAYENVIYHSFDSSRKENISNGVKKYYETHESYNKGKTGIFSEESLLRMSESAKNRPRKNHTEETKKKIGEANKKRWEEKRIISNQNKIDR